MHIPYLNLTMSFATKLGFEGILTRNLKSEGI